MDPLVARIGRSERRASAALGVRGLLMPPSPACLWWWIICAPKKTSGPTWDQALREMRPLIVRSRGFCPCCLTEFENFLPVTT
jgi:hypothetical protein